MTRGYFDHAGDYGTLATMCTKRAGKLLGVSHRTLEDWRLKGFGPCFLKIGRKVRYRAVDLAAFMDSRVFSNTGEALAA